MRVEEAIEAPTMGQRATCLSNAVSPGGELLRFSFWMRGDASLPPLHVHPRQEERIEVVSGSVFSLSGGVRRVLGPGGTISTPPGEPHTIGPAGEGAVEMIVGFAQRWASSASSSARLFWIAPATYGLHLRATRCDPPRVTFDRR